MDPFPLTAEAGVGVVTHRTALMPPPLLMNTASHGPPPPPPRSAPPIATHQNRYFPDLCDASGNSKEEDGTPTPTGDRQISELKQGALSNDQVLCEGSVGLEGAVTKPHVTAADATYNQDKPQIDPQHQELMPPSLAPDSFKLSSAASDSSLYRRRMGRQSESATTMDSGAFSARTTPTISPVHPTTDTQPMAHPHAPNDRQLLTQLESVLVRLYRQSMRDAGVVVDDGDWDQPLRTEDDVRVFTHWLNCFMTVYQQQLAGNMRSFYHGHGQLAQATATRLFGPAQHHQQSAMVGRGGGMMGDTRNVLLNILMHGQGQGQHTLQQQTQQECAQSQQQGGGSNMATWSSVLPPPPPSNCRAPVLYSCKLFVGGVPWDASEESIHQAFSVYGACCVEWPGNHTRNSSHVLRSPTKQAVAAQGKRKVSGYVYVVYEVESSIHAVLDQCSSEFGQPGERYFKLSVQRTNTREIRQVQVIPWIQADSTFTRHTPSLPPPASLHAAGKEGVQHVTGGPGHGHGASANHIHNNTDNYNGAVDASRTLFVGALHGMITAPLLAQVMHDMFGTVLSVHIDTDRHHYPIGSGRVVFSSQKSFVKAVRAAYVDIRLGMVTKRVQLDPFLEERACSVCAREVGPNFCRELVCFKYFCSSCWQKRHDLSGALRAHKPLIRNMRKQASLQSHERGQGQGAAAAWGSGCGH